MVGEIHSWAVSIQDAFRIQKELTGQLLFEDDPDDPVLIAGVDVAFSRTRDLLFAAIVVLDYATMEPVEVVSAAQQPVFPYVPDLLTFREGPVVIQAYEQLEHSPDLLMFDGQGIAHPRGLGLAAHMGAILDKPSIGCATTRLVGDFKEPKQKRGAMRTLSLHKRKVGVVLRTKNNTKPLFVSPGHRITVERAVEVILEAGRDHRLPEPTRLAHQEATRARREYQR